MKISITGASGFLGKSICEQLKNHNINILSRKDFDLSNPNNINLLDTDVFIHCAAYLPNSFEDPTEAVKCITDNGIATLKLLQMAKEANVKKFIYISSGTIYDTTVNTAKEEDSIYPSMRASYYLTSKFVGDVFADYFGNTSDMKVVIIRPSCIYGVGMKPKGFISRIIEKIKKNEIIKSEDVGNYNLDLVNVDDVAWMVKQATLNDDIIGKINVGGGSKKTSIDIVNIILKIFNKPLLTTKSFKLKSHATLNITKAKSFGYKPKKLSKGLKEYIDSLIQIPTV